MIILFFATLRIFEIACFKSITCQCRQLKQFLYIFHENELCKTEDLWVLVLSSHRVFSLKLTTLAFPWHFYKKIKAGTLVSAFLYSSRVKLTLFHIFRPPCSRFSIFFGRLAHAFPYFSAASLMLFYIFCPPCSRFSISITRHAFPYPSPPRNRAFHIFRPPRSRFSIFITRHACVHNRMRAGGTPAFPGARFFYIKTHRRKHGFLCKQCNQWMFTSLKRDGYGKV